MLSNARPKYNVNKVPRWVFCYVGNKLLISPVEKGIFCPKTAKFGSKLAFLVNLGQGMHLVPCWCVGWWLWRAGCISQDTYLLYCICFPIFISVFICVCVILSTKNHLYHISGARVCASDRGKTSVSELSTLVSRIILNGLPCLGHRRWRWWSQFDAVAIKEFTRSEIVMIILVFENVLQDLSSVQKDVSTEWDVFL